MWQTIRDNKAKAINIVPTGETHFLDGECWCGLEVKEVNGWTIYTHHSLDRREYFEENPKTQEVIN